MRRTARLFHRLALATVLAVLAPLCGHAQMADGNGQSAARVRFQEQVVMLPKAAIPSRIDLEATVFKPTGAGPFPLVVINHGKAPGRPGMQGRNRYGARVYLNDHYQNDWEGTYGGKPLPDGTYYYIITYQLINGKIVNTKGNVTILR